MAFIRPTQCLNGLKLWDTFGLH